MPQKFSYEYNPRTVEHEALRKRLLAKGLVEGTNKWNKVWFRHWPYRGS